MKILSETELKEKVTQILQALAENHPSEPSFLYTFWFRDIDIDPIESKDSKEVTVSIRLSAELDPQTDVLDTIIRSQIAGELYPWRSGKMNFNNK